MNTWTIDITGNFSEANGFLPFIQTREPWVKDGRDKEFHQRLILPASEYSIELCYSVLLDKKPGWSVRQAYDCFNGLKINGKVYPVKFEKTGEDSGEYRAKCDFIVNNGDSETEISLSLFNTRVMRTILHGFSQLEEKTAYQAISPEMEGELLVVHGIPFYTREVNTRFFPANLKFVKQKNDPGSLSDWNEGMFFQCYDIPVNTVHFLGMIHCYDIANGSWYNKKNDHGYSHFAGDKAGEIVIDWADGGQSSIPLVFGFNMWYSRPWDMLWHYEEYIPGTGGDNFDSVLFDGNEEYRNIISDNVSLVDGIRLMGSHSCNARYIFSVELGGRRVRSIRVNGSDEMYGYPVISAVTFETAENTRELVSLPSIHAGEKQIIPVPLDYAVNEEYLSRIEKIKKVLYTNTNELPDINEPEIPEGYFGPGFDFKGTREAVYAATYLYYNGPECAAYIADSGTGCSSSTAKWSIPHYTLGVGVWFTRRPWEEWEPGLREIQRKLTLYPIFRSMQDWFIQYKERSPGQLPGMNSAWTRGVGELLREAMAFGYHKFVKSYIKWLDNALFTEANPPHWNRIAGEPGRTSKEIQVGDVIERGNRENDGHGICMWGRYMVWHWLGRPYEWNKEIWEATKASVEWIQWQLDTDHIRPGVRKDVLYTESECAHGDYDIYSTYNCLHGIKLSIRMAEQLEKKEEVKKWTALYERIRRGIIEHLVDNSEYGPIWHTEPDCDWQDHAHALVHLQLAADGDTYTPLDDYMSGNEIDRYFMQVTLNTYRFLTRDKNYDCLRMYGYGQGMMAQSALLLDQMEDAERFINKLVTYCYLPRLGRWVSPEGIIVHKSGEYYVPVKAYTGQDSHVADSTKAVRIMLGIDDNDPEHLKIVPRFPASWNYMSIDSYPVLYGTSRQHINYKYTRDDNSQIFSFTLEQKIDRLSVRLGPIPGDRKITKVLLNNDCVDCFESVSGDSRWILIKNISGKTGTIRIETI